MPEHPDIIASIKWLEKNCSVLKVFQADVAQIDQLINVVNKL